ncbi:MAG: 4Fe-4S binding protein [Candidatus Omnitrophota bacterium]
MAKRKIVKIDEEKCNGCGLCIPNCHEGALRIIDGKARLISGLCDGLGACIGHCPKGAITIIEEGEAGHAEHACPGSKAMDLKSGKKDHGEKGVKGKTASRLSNWPVQIMLVPENAPYLKGADLLIAADCVPFAYPDFHDGLLRGKVLLVGCPKLDDAGFYKEKIASIIKNNGVRSVTCAHMEVPCCFGLVSLAREAIASSGRDVKFEEITIGIRGGRS